MRKLTIFLAACAAVALITLHYCAVPLNAFSSDLPTSANTDKGRALIIVDLKRLTLSYYVDEREMAHYPIAAGDADSPSPIGVWKVVSKMEGWEECYGTRWLGLNCPWGSYGIHGTNNPNSIGNKVSLGCIRMLNADVEELYAMIPLGTCVIVEYDRGELPASLSTIEPGDRGNLVRLTQLRLRNLGYYDGRIDGIYGPRMEAAVYAFKLDYGPDDTLYVGPKTYALLGIAQFE